MTHKLLLSALLAVSCWVAAAAAIAETPEDVKQRMDLYRKREEAAEQKKADRAAEDAARREKTRLWQEERKAEEYARTWKRYGSDEVNILSWRQHKDGSWVADAKLSSPVPKENSLTRRPPARFDSSLDALVRDGVVNPAWRTQIHSGEGMPPIESRAVVRFGDTVLKIAQRYGLTLQDLLRLNPGLETARLVVGRQVRIAQSGPERTRMNLGLKPTSSGGISWPELPSFDQTSDQRLKISQLELIGVNCATLQVNRKPRFENWGKWVRPEPFSADEQLVVDRCATSNSQVLFLVGAIPRGATFSRNWFSWQSGRHGQETSWRVER